MENGVGTLDVNGLLTHTTVKGKNIEYQGCSPWGKQFLYKKKINDTGCKLDICNETIICPSSYQDLGGLCSKDMHFNILHKQPLKIPLAIR